MSIAKSIPASAKPTPTAEGGTALVGTLIGFAIFLLLLLFAAQVLVRLYASSMLGAVAFDAAHQVASDPQPAEVQLAEANARRSLGSFGGSHTVFDWEEVDAQQIVLKVTAESPGFLPLPASSRRIERTVTVRTERFR